MPLRFRGYLFLQRNPAHPDWYQQETSFLLQMALHTWLEKTLCCLGSPGQAPEEFSSWLPAAYCMVGAGTQPGMHSGPSITQRQPMSHLPHYSLLGLKPPQPHPAWAPARPEPAPAGLPLWNFLPSKNIEKLSGNCTRISASSEPPRHLRSLQPT